jgi:hypothetical protein
MESGSTIVISIIIVAVIAALIIEYYQSTSTKLVAAQCDKTKKSVKCRLNVMLYNKLVMIRKTIIGIALIVIGLSVFGTSYNEALTGQEYYSTFLCAVVTTTKTQCTIANNQMTGRFIFWSIISGTVNIDGVD